MVPKSFLFLLALKHYTSKIREFSDLEAIETLGFRGEALSSLCALSNLTIITCHKSADIATKITYDHAGLITSETPTAREAGTTVTLSHLFCTLPVRKKEFTKNLKREFSKMCQLLYAYCLVCKNIRFSCTNQTNKSSVNSVVVTEGASTVRENIINVFGTKQLSTLIDVEVVMPDDSILKEYGVQLIPGEPLPFSFELIISSASHGHGRSTTDRQFYYINSRPCEPPKIIKLVNEVYRQFNSNQYPFVYLNIFVEKGQFDVNVTPDKRQVFVAKEKLLLACLKTSLLEAFKEFPSILKMQNVGITKTKGDQLHESLRGLKRAAPELRNVSITELFKKRPKTESEAVNANLADERCTENDNKKLPKIGETVTYKIETCTFEEEKVENKNLDILMETIKSEQEHTGVNDPLVNSFIMLDEETEKTDRTVITLDISLEKIREALKKTDLADTNEEVIVKFRSKISPDSNENAEKELQKQISKEMFKQMSIVGQFNHGFIITKLKSDLFIVDQHASDEKYNFEHLQASTVLERQVLVKYVLTKGVAD